MRNIMEKKSSTVVMRGGCFCFMAPLGVITFNASFYNALSFLLQFAALGKKLQNLSAFCCHFHLPVQEDDDGETNEYKANRRGAKHSK